MLQNPHHYPRASCTLTGVMLPHQCREARRGTDKRREGAADGACYTGAGRTGADKRQKGIADRTGAGERSTSSTTTLVADEAMRPIKKSQPQLIGLNLP